VIIGSGFASLTAAIESRNSGASVAIIEKINFIGATQSSMAATLQPLDPNCKKRPGCRTPLN